MISGFKGRIIYCLDNFLYVQNDLSLCEIMVEEPKNFTLGQEVYFYLYVQKQINKYVETVINFGFTRIEDLLIFKRLIEIKGVGLKTAYRLIKSDFSRLINLAKDHQSNMIQEEFVLSAKTADSICRHFSNQQVAMRSLKEQKKLNMIIDYLNELGYLKPKVKSVVYQYAESLLTNNWEEMIPFILNKIRDE